MVSSPRCGYLPGWPGGGFHRECGKGVDGPEEGERVAGLQHFAQPECVGSGWQKTSPRVALLRIRHPGDLEVGSVLVDPELQ